MRNTARDGNTRLAGGSTQSTVTPLAGVDRISRRACASAVDPGGSGAVSLASRPLPPLCLVCRFRRPPDGCEAPTPST